jgi:Zn finger protein HypA/HybF involved in hydrogenase expression
MFNVVNKTCKHEDCNTIPTFGTEIGKALYCVDHKLAGMFDVVSKKCKHENCKKHPVFGTEIGKALYCVDHKLAGMFNVKSKKCKNENCNTIPTFGDYENGKIYCAKHYDKKTQWKISTCVNSRCRKVAIWSKTAIIHMNTVMTVYPTKIINQKLLAHVKVATLQIYY